MDARQTDNFTPLMLACNVGSLPLVQLLLKKGAEPDAMGANLRTAAHIASLGGHATVLKELIDYGANKNLKVYPQPMADPMGCISLTVAPHHYSWQRMEDTMQLLKFYWNAKHSSTNPIPQNHLPSWLLPREATSK